MPGYPSSPQTPTVTDTLAHIAPTLGNRAGYYVWLANQASGVTYGPSNKTAANGSWTISSVPVGTYSTFYGQEGVAGVAPTRWQVAGSVPYVVTGAATIYAPSGWDTVWQAGKASLQPRVLVIGASDASGYLSTDCTTKGFIEILRAQLVAQYGVWGDLYHSRINVVDSVNFTGTPPFVNNGAAPTQQFRGYGTLDTWAGTGSTLLTFTSPYACTQMDIIYLDGVGASPPQYAVDGGSQVAFPALGGTGKQLRLSITGLAATTHTLTLRQQTATSLHCCGVAIYPTGSAATTGLGFGRMNFPGSAGIFYMLQTGWGPVFPNGQDIIDYLADATSAPGTRPITTGFGFPTNPHLVILVLDLMGNDVNQALTAANPTSPQGSHEAMRRILSACRRAVDDVSFILMIPSLPDGMYSDLLTANTIGNGWSWQDYKNKAWDLAFEFNAAVVDSDADFGNLGVTNGYQTQANGGFHLTDAGHARTAVLTGSLL